MKLKDQPTPEPCFHKTNSFEAQLANAEGTIRSIVIDNNFDRIEVAYDENGFFNLKGAALEEYIQFKGGEIWDKAYDDFKHSKLDRFPLSKNYEGVLFSRDEAISNFRDFILNAIRNRKEENAG